MYFRINQKTKPIKSPNQRPLLKDVKVLTDEELETALINFDRETLLKKYISVVFRLAGNYARKCPALVDDLISEGLLGFNVAFEDYKNGKVTIDEAEKHFYYQICKHCFDLLRKEKKNKQLNFDVGFKPDHISAILNHLEDIATTELERTIIKLRLEGFTDQEIADQVGLSKQYIGRVRSQLKVKFAR